MISDIFKKDSAGRIVMMGAALLEKDFANSPLEKFYLLFLETPVQVKVPS